MLPLLRDTPSDTGTERILEGFKEANRGTKRTC
jgi:hypothetical protein